jgi:hypothetical protein
MHKKNEAGVNEAKDVMSLTQENVTDLQIVGKDPMKNMRITSFHWSALDSLIHNKLEVKFTYNSCHTQHYRKSMYYLIHTKHDCTSATMHF